MPAELIQEALTLNANQPMALWLAGMAASERGDEGIKGSECLKS
ncbi:MAG: hypothetical protein ABFS02_09665 [Pseudomonadota bacterium]